MNGVIYLGEDSTKKDAYHEAFHSILQDLLNNQEIDQILSEGQSLLLNKLRAQGKTLRQHIREKRESGYFQSVTDEKAMPKVVEEFLADEFAEWRMEQDAKHPLVKFFQRIIDAIRSLWSRKSELQTLFDSIDRGYFSGKAQATNRFSEGASNMNPDYKLMRKSNGQYFSAEATALHVAKLVSAYTSIQELPKAKKEAWGDERIVDFIIDIARDSPLYNKDPDLVLLHTEESYTDIDGSTVIGRRAELREAMLNNLRTFKEMSSLRDELEDLKTDLGERVALNAESAPQGGLDTIPSYVGMI